MVSRDIFLVSAGVRFSSRMAFRGGKRETPSEALTSSVCRHKKAELSQKKERTHLSGEGEEEPALWPRI